MISGVFFILKMLDKKVLLYYSKQKCFLKLKFYFTKFMLTNELIIAIAMHQTTLFLLQRRILFKKIGGKNSTIASKPYFKLYYFR